MGDDWHEFFEDFPDQDPANSHLSEAELAAKCALAPGWKWVEEAEERAKAQREKAARADDEDATDPA